MSEDKKNTALTEIEEVASSFTAKVRDLVIDVLGDLLQEVKLEKDETKEKTETVPPPAAEEKKTSNVRSIR